MNIATLDAKLFTTMFDNTARTDNKYDVRVTNEADVSFQKTDANGAMYNGFDIIEIPSNAFGLKNNFNVHVGNVNFNYIFTEGMTGISVITG